MKGSEKQKSIERFGVRSITIKYQMKQKIFRKSWKMIYLLRIMKAEIYINIFREGF